MLPSIITTSLEMSYTLTQLRTLPLLNNETQ